MDTMSLIDNGIYARGNVIVGEEEVGYSIFTIDARSEDQKKKDQNPSAPNRRLNIFIPGHGQRVRTARKLMTRIVTRTKEKILWSIKIDPTRGGDPTKAMAMVEIIKGLVQKGSDSDQQIPGRLKGES